MVERLQWERGERLCEDASARMRGKRSSWNGNFTRHPALPVGRCVFAQWLIKRGGFDSNVQDGNECVRRGRVRRRLRSRLMSMGSTILVQHRIVVRINETDVASCVSTE